MSKKAPKTFTMWAAPYNAASLDKTLDVETAGACALFASPLLADGFVQNRHYAEGTRMIKVRVTIERSGSRRKKAK